MRRLTLAAAAICLAGMAQAADPVTGAWRTQADDNGNFALVRIVPCGDALCGTIARAYDSSGTPMESEKVGRRIVWDMQPRGGGSYADGRIWAPDRDKVYDSRMQLSGDRLEVKGCVFGICRGQTWARAR